MYFLNKKTHKLFIELLIEKVSYYKLKYNTLNYKVFICYLESFF